MLTFLVRRLGLLVPVAFGVTLIVFLLVRLIPGDPAVNLLGIHQTPQLLAQLHAQMGLDRSLPEQYLIYLGRLVHGDLGTSYFYGQSVFSLVTDRLLPTPASSRRWSPFRQRSSPPAGVIRSGTRSSGSRSCSGSACPATGSASS